MEKPEWVRLISNDDPEQFCHIAGLDQISTVGPPYTPKPKGRRPKRGEPEPDVVMKRMVALKSGQTVYVIDCPENLEILGIDEDSDVE